MKKLSINFILLLSLFIVFLAPLTTYAGTVPADAATGILPPVTLTNPLATGGDNPTPQALIGRVINATMGLVGSLALAMFIYGGFIWMLAAGNEQSVQKGKDILTWATIGLIVIFSSYALVNLVFEGLGVT